MKHMILAAALVAALAGCVSSEIHVLKNPATGEIVRCERNSGPSLFPIVQTIADNGAARSCADGYEAAGWQRLN
jgi:hypothetical protein